MLKLKHVAVTVGLNDEGLWVVAVRRRRGSWTHDSRYVGVKSSTMSTLAWVLDCCRRHGGPFVGAVIHPRGRGYSFVWQS